MSSPMYHSDPEDENHLTTVKIDHVSDKINDLQFESQSAIERIRDLQDTVGNLKSELQGIVFKVEQNVEIFKGIITNKIALILGLLTKKQSHIQNTLENCYMIIDNLVETFLNIGYELEKDINVIALKVNDFDSEIRKMKDGRIVQSGVDETTMWFINSEGKLTKRKNIILSSALPRFKCGDRKTRRSFILYLEEVFNAYQVPKNLWVPLAASQLIGMACDWWNMHDKNMAWQQFTKCFIDWTFSDNNIRRKMLPLKKQIEEIGKLNSKNEHCSSEMQERGCGYCNSYNKEELCNVCENMQHNSNDLQKICYKPLSTSTIGDYGNSCENSEMKYTTVLEKSLQKVRILNAEANEEDDTYSAKTSSNSSSERSIKKPNLENCSHKRKSALENQSSNNKYKLRKRKK